MKLYSSNDSYKLYHGNMLDMLEVIEPNSIDSIVTDPPYELGFMGKNWDKSGIVFQKETWKKCYEVLKPGGYLLAFGGSRTFHRIACAIEDAGFEIRDTIMWLYGSGFPKSHDISKAIDKQAGAERKVIGKSSRHGGGLKGNGTSYELPPDIPYITAPATPEAQQWDGWGTALKPSFEPIIVARKPVEGTVVNNVLKWGVGGINIDECRVEGTQEYLNGKGNETIKEYNNIYQFNSNKLYIRGNPNKLGRFPANTILTYDETDFDEVCGGLPHTKYNDSGSAARYFYCAKASKKDRDEGLDEFENVDGGSYQFRQDGSSDGKIPVRKNIHPAVKPTELMQYLVRLVTPKGGTILDPFNGSGSTGKAVMYENKERNKNYKYIGIELVEEYLPIAKARIEYVCNLNKLILTSQLQIEKINEETGKDKQLNLFELIGS